tara:strand:- start:1581 stop:2540 length:960 start_codon:yes stop_codon:yes gene_type:complete
MSKKKSNYTNISKKNDKEKNLIKKKINLIFDIDETLIKMLNTKNNSVILDVEKNTLTNIYTSKKKNNILIFIRKYCLFLLEYCINNFNVGVWTTGDEDVDVKLKSFMPEKLYKKLNIIIYRKSINEKKMICNDLKNNIEFESYRFNGQLGKNLDLLFNHKFYSKIFKPNNTILIDDNSSNISASPLNSIFVPEYCLSNNDDVLFQLFQFLRKINVKNDVRKIQKNIFNINQQITTNNCAKKMYQKKIKHNSGPIIDYIKTNKLEIGDYVEFTKKDKEIRGYISNINKDKFEIVEYDEETPKESDLKIHKNISELKKNSI